MTAPINKRSKILIRGSAAIDWRSAGAIELRKWRDSLIDALGGPVAVSPQRKTLIELACRNRAWLDECDAYLFSLPSIIVKRRKSLIPLVEQRMRIADSLMRLMEKLGLDFIAKPVEAIDTAAFRAAREEIKKLATKGEDDDETTDGN